MPARRQRVLSFKEYEAEHKPHGLERMTCPRTNGRCPMCRYGTTVYTGDEGYYNRYNCNCCGAKMLTVNTERWAGKHQPRRKYGEPKRHPGAD
jgi:hypothetical protein